MDETEYDENHIVVQYKNAVAAKMFEGNMTQKEAHRAIRNNWLAEYKEQKAIAAQEAEGNTAGSTALTLDM